MQPFHQCSSVKESFGTASLHINASKQPYRLTVWWTLEMGTLLASVRLKGLKIPSLVCKSEVFRRCFFDAFLEDIESWRPLLVKRWQMLQKSGSTLVSELLFRTEKVTKRLRGYQGFHPWSTLDSNKRQVLHQFGRHVKTVFGQHVIFSVPYNKTEWHSG